MDIFMFIAMIICISSLVAVLFMSLILYPLKALQKNGSKKLALMLILLIVTVCLFLTPVAALTFSIFLITLICISLTSKNRYVIFTFLTLYFLIFIAHIPVWLPRGSREKAKRISCSSNLKQLGTSLYMYAGDNNGHFPNKDGDAGLEMLRKQNYLGNYAVYLCPATTDSESKAGQLKSSYIYHGGLTTAAPEKTILAEDKPGNHKGYINYLYCGMRVKGVKDPNYHDPAKDPIIKRLFRWFGWR